MNKLLIIVLAVYLLSICMSSVHANRRYDISSQDFADALQREAESFRNSLTAATGTQKNRRISSRRRRPTNAKHGQNEIITSLENKFMELKRKASRPSPRQTTEE